MYIELFDYLDLCLDFLPFATSITKEKVVKVDIDFSKVRPGYVYNTYYNFF